jgi:Terminase large subunit, T4likevirus-type, N-terminal
VTKVQAASIIEVGIRPPQASVLRSDRRFRVLVAGRRFGKTQIALLELFRAVCARSRMAWYVAPTYKQAKRIAWKRLKDLTRAYRARVNETDLRLDFAWGSTIALRGADNYDSLRGEGLDLVVLDEFATMQRQAWTEVLLPSLADRRGRALFIGTPKGYNHFYDLYEAASGNADWARFQFTTAEGGNVSPEELAAAARELDERTYRQEFLARFENLGTGRVYYAFSREDNVRPVQYNRKLGIVWSLDFNVNPMCSVIGQLEEDFSPAHFDFFTLVNRDEKRIKTLRILDEIWIPNSNTADACQEFATRILPYLDRDPNLQVKIYGDASGSARQTAAGAGAKSDWEIVRREMKRMGIQASFHYKSSNPGVKNRVAAVNSLLKSTSGEIRLFIDPKCKHLIKDLEQVAWKPGTALIEKDKNPDLTHISDALGYLVETEAGIRTEGGFMPDRII